MAESYGVCTSLALDPIEKKPLYHFYPGSHILSVGSYGCNMSCEFCQNHAISTQRVEGHFCSPSQLARISLETPGNLGVAFTYNEPLISFEYLLECAPLIHQQQQKVALVSNGMISPRPWAELLPWVDAVNIDLKCFREEGYRWLGGCLSAVKATIQSAAAVCHLEVTTLIVPGFNDQPQEMDALSRWLAEIHPAIPLHISRFFPRHRMEDEEATPVSVIYDLAERARKRLDFVYTGNC